ncbi:MAG: c-type cytochrome domain-containing protein, partial [Planctomycetia bacterium]
MVHSFACRWRAIATALSTVLAWPAAVTVAAAPVSFNRDIRPILSDNCFSCHGPDAGHRQADLRLDVRDDAVAAGAIVPGKPAESTLVARIDAADPGELMPPPESHKKLDAGQKALLARWIEQGAEYQKHWAYEPPRKPEIPTGSGGIDHLVGRPLAEVGLRPSREADRRTLIRRLSFDLVGLPPSPADVEAFVADTRPDA